MFKMNGIKIAILLFLLFIPGCTATSSPQNETKRGLPIDILSAPIDTLRGKLTGKTFEEVIALVGEPHQLAVIKDHDAWVYVHNSTTSGKAIIFDDNERVITVNLYE